jgi:hypothetical protein
MCGEVGKGTKSRGFSAVTRRTEFPMCARKARVSEFRLAGCSTAPPIAKGDRLDNGIYVPKCALPDGELLDA